MNNLAQLIQRRNVGFAGPEGDLINEQAAQLPDQGLPHTTITNNSLAGIMKPQNYIQRSGGQRIDVGPSMQEVNAGGGNTGYRDQSGNVTIYTYLGAPVTISAQEIADYQKQGENARALKKLQDQAMIHELQVKAGLAPKEADKPIFNADMGGYVYPPSAENPNGKFMPIAGATKTAKPLTESQSKFAMFGARAAAASDLVDQLTDPETVSGAKTLQHWQGVPLVGRAVSGMSSDKTVAMAQAQRDFVNAVLRPESGASISQGEFDNAMLQYFPQPGDSKEIISQKKASRDREIEGLKMGAGTAGSEYVDVQRKKAPATTLGAPTGYEQTATNPRTGEKIGFRNGKWEPIR
jgi:hypothetical protein